MRNKFCSRIIIQKTNYNEMNIKISIKDCDCQPTVITKKEISEVEFKKKNMLYAPPTKDNKSLKNSTKRNPQATLNLQSRKNEPKRYLPNEQAERKFLNQMSQISRNQVTSDMIQNTNTVLQKQNQILEENQRTIHHMLTNPQNASISREKQTQNTELKRVFQESADKIAREVKEIKKMRDEILEYGQNFKKTTNEGKSPNISKGSLQIGQMNSNLKNLVQISKNHIEGLQNLEGIKSLQNFNMQAYTQAVNTLKKQIVQYQKQSQNIERQLKLRAAKLQKLEISPNFDEQLLQPYEQHLKKKADSIDLHSIKQKIYEKLGVFDYGKFETDVCGITNQIKNQMNDFYIICKQFRIQIPDIKIDKKQLKELDLKLPSVLDEYKASKGINFSQRIIAQGQKKGMETKKSPVQLPTTTSKQKMSQSKKNPLKKSSPVQKDYGQIYSKPVDLSKNTKLTRTDQAQQKTVLQTSQQKQRKQVVRNIKKPSNPDDDFQRYLQNRAKQQLASIYEQKRKKLQQMEKELYRACTEEPKYELTLNVKNKLSPKKSVPKPQTKRQEDDQEYQEDFEDQEEHIDRIKPENTRKPEINKETQEIKNIGTQVLRQKLKSLFSKNPNLNEHTHQNRLIQEYPQANVQANQLNTIAEGFISMINNTLTQVNTQLSQSIQKKMENRSFSQQKRPVFERGSPTKITVPKLQEFRAPPVFNMQMVYEPTQKTDERKVDKKIVSKDYNYLRIQQENNDLEISSISYED